jgi:antitoxin VapB
MKQLPDGREYQLKKDSTSRFPSLLTLGGTAFPRLYIRIQFVYNTHMPLSIRNSEVERLARALARLTGEGLTQTILQALRERYQRVRAARQGERLVEDLTSIARRAAALPQRDRRSPDEIIGYDEHGLPR